MSELPAPGARPLVPSTRGRSIAMHVLLVLAGVLLLLSSFAVWVNRVALNTDVFVATSTELIEDDEIREAVALRAVDELYSSVDVKALIEEQTPKNLDPFAGVAAAGARQALYQILDRALRQPALQRLWALSLEQSHTTLVRVLEGDGEVVTSQEGIVVLDLRPIVLEAAERIGIRNEVELRLPLDAGRIEVLRSNELDAAQDAFQLLKALAWLLPLLTLAVFGLVLWLARARRRAVRQVGIAIAAVGIVGLVAVNVVGGYVVNELVADTESRQAAANSWDILTETLRASFRWFVAVGILCSLAAWLAGPGRRALATRRVLAPAFRERVWAYAGLAVVGLILLLTGPTQDFARLLVVLVLIALAAAWIELMRAQTLREFPGATGPDLLDEAQARLATWWTGLRSEAGARAAPPVVPAADLTTRLTQLAELHARGELSDVEYAAAKARVLAGD